MSPPNIKAERCDIRGCREEGLWKPLVSIPRVDDKNCEARLELRVCKKHKEDFGVNTFLEMVWYGIEKEFLLRGLTPPLKEKAMLKWERWHPEIIVI